VLSYRRDSLEVWIIEEREMITGSGRNGERET
jgi:hypothetical protein